MMRITGWGARLGAMISDNRGGPWGPGGGGSGGGSGGGDGDGEGGGPRSPWGQPPRKRRPMGPRNVTSIDDFLKRSKERFGGRLPTPGDGRPYWAYGLGVFVLLWVVFTSFHQVGPQEAAVVTRFGSFNRVMAPGIGLTFPLPIERIQRVDVREIKTKDIGSTDPNRENLILTADQNIIDLAYSVRWNIKDPEDFLFRIDDPDATIGEVAESAMRNVIAGVTLDEAIGAGRGDVEQRVQQLMQQILDVYGAGVQIQGIAIKQSDPPAAVNDAFKEVSAAQQEAQSYINQARAYALQLTAKAQGEAAAFDKVYAQYKLSPEVTRRRMYYETMERVLSKTDKTIVETPGVTAYLPLPEVARRAEGAQR